MFTQTNFEYHFQSIWTKNMFPQWYAYVPTMARKLKKEVVYPTIFRMKEGTEELDDPFGQAEYAYSLIEIEVNKNGSQ